MATLSLPDRRTARFAPYTLRGAPIVLPPKGAAPTFNRVAYAAAHVVADPLADIDPWLDAAVDWDATIAFRQLPVGPRPRRRRGDGHRAARHGPRLADGARADPPLARRGARRARRADRLRRRHRPSRRPTRDVTIDDVIRAYEEQIEAIEGAGRPHHPDGEPRARRASRKSPDDYARVYDRILSQVQAAGDPPLARRDVRPGARRLLGHRRPRWRRWRPASAIIARHAAKVDGIKISLLDKEKEIAMRRRLPAGVRMYTGDDFNYAELIAGDEQGHSRRAARHLRRDRAGRVARRWRALGRGRPRALPRHPRADRAAVAPHLRGADALLQDRRRVPGLAQRPPGPLHDGRRPAERALARCISPSCSASPTGRPAARPRAGGGAHAARCSPCTASR